MFKRKNSRVRLSAQRIRSIKPTIARRGKRKAIARRHTSPCSPDSNLNCQPHWPTGFQVLDSGCCGMAGSFGFEAEKYDVSVKIGERVLLPAVRLLPQTR